MKRTMILISLLLVVGILLGNLAEAKPDKKKYKLGYIYKTKSSRAFDITVETNRQAPNPMGGGTLSLSDKNVFSFEETVNKGSKSKGVVFWKYKKCESFVSRS